LELDNKDKEALIRCGFLDLALAGTIGKTHGELNRECGDFRVLPCRPVFEACAG
jgi:hypothetical protein